ncbi:hypothetical protein M9Y10_023466 [Tritrichomonas musculus]|uniref:Importin N-terminal domain-containing protein n=1 Tax=Tritrichomonas musculus TaxID=1915356 RepID=A0ABR2KV75_9EUKA
MENIDAFNSILQAILSGNNELIQQAQNKYIELLNETPEDLALMHFHIISTTNNEQVRRLALILLGNYFTLLDQFKKNISAEASQEIKLSLIMFFQNENFTQYHFEILTNVILKSAQYFKNNWPELADQLISLLNHLNSIISSTAVCCLAECIKKCLINQDKYFDVLFSYVQNSLNSPSEPFSITVSSSLQLLYSLIHVKQIFNNPVLNPIISLIPKYLTIFRDDPKTINNFCIFAYNNVHLFKDSLQDFFQTMISIIESPDFSTGIKNSAICILDLFITHYPAFFQPHSISLFDFFVSKLPIEETHESFIALIANLSGEYGGNDKYALHVYDFFTKNVPNPIAYIAIGASYEGIKDHFSHICFSDELLDYFSQGFTSENDFTRLKAFQYFVPIIKIFYKYNDNISANSDVNILLNVIINEENPQVLFYELKMLSKLLSYYSELLTQIIPDIIKLLDQLIGICNQPQYITILLRCYISIAQSEKYSDLKPYSQHSALKISQYINNPIESDDLFFYCLKALPSFKSLISQDLFDESIAHAFSFLFSVVYDDNGNENPNYSLTSYASSCISKFFLSCLVNDAIKDSPQILEKIVMISFKVVSIGPSCEIINNDSDITLYENYQIFAEPKENHWIAIPLDETLKIQNHLAILTQIFSMNSQLIPPLFQNIYDLIKKLLPATYCSQLLSAVYELELLIYPFIQTDKQILDLLEIHAFSQATSLKNLSVFAKLLIVIIKTVNGKWNNNEKIIQILFSFALFLFHFVDKKSNAESSIADEIQNIAYNDYSSQKASINCAFTFRELFRYFPIMSVNVFPQIFNLVQSNKTVASIVFSDFIRFCPQENPEFFFNIVEFYKQGIQSNHISVRLDSICGLSIIMTPQFIDIDSMKIFYDMFLNCLQDHYDNNDIKARIAFALLQIFQNYYSIFDVSLFFPDFFQFLGTDVNRIPKYFRENYSQSLIFFVSNFKDIIFPNYTQKIQFIIKELLKKHLDPTLIGGLNSAYEILNQ